MDGERLHARPLIDRAGYEYYPEPEVCPYPGPVCALIWIAAIAGSWALVVGAISVSAFLIDRIAGLIGGMGL